MFDTFSLSFNQVIILLAYIGAGYAAAKFKLIGEEAVNVLSKLALWIFLPSYAVANFIRTIRKETFAAQIALIIAATVVLAVTFAVAYFLGRIFGGKDKYMRNVYHYCFVFTNNGYMGYPLIQSVYGDVMLGNMMIFLIPFSLVLYSWGTSALDSRSKFSWKKWLFTPINISMVLGIVMGLLELSFPAPIMSALDGLGGCMVPVCLMLVGLSLAKKPIMQMVVGVKPYLYCLLRLIVIPAVFAVAAYLIGVPRDIIIIMTINNACPASANGVMLAESGGSDGVPLARLSFLSHILSLVTIPLVCAALSLI